MGRFRELESKVKMFWSIILVIIFVLISSEKARKDLIKLLIVAYKWIKNILSR